MRNPSDEISVKTNKCASDGWNLSCNITCSMRSPDVTLSTLDDVIWYLANSDHTCFKSGSLSEALVNSERTYSM